MSRSSVELLVACAVCGLCVAGLFEAWSYAGASRYMPVAVIGFALVLGLIWAAQSAVALVRGRAERMAVASGDLGRFAGIVLAVALYVLGVVWIGFFTSTLVMVPALSAALGYLRWDVALVATLGFAAVLYGVFRLLLAIPLPPEAVLEILGG